MAYKDVLPFALGTTFGGGATLTSANSADGEGLLGTRYRVTEPVRYGGEEIEVEIVRNSAAFNLLPKQVVQYKSGKWGKEVDTPTVTTGADAAGVVDERLPSAGVAQYDLFYIVVNGPTKVKRKKSGNLASGGGAAGSKLTALTAGTTGASDAGAFGNQDLTGATAVLAVQVSNVIGRLIDTADTTATTVDPVVYVSLGSRP